MDGKDKIINYTCLASVLWMPDPVIESVPELP